MKHDQNFEISASERKAAWDVLWSSPTVRMLAVLAGPYWRHPTATQVASSAAHKPNLAERQVLFAEANRYSMPSQERSEMQRREALLDDALDDSFPASDPPSLVAPGSAA